MCRRRAFAAIVAVLALTGACESGSGGDPELEASVIEGLPDPPRDPEPVPFSPWADITGVSCGEDAEGAYVRGNVTNTAGWTLSFMITAEFRDRTNLPYGASVSLTEEVPPGETAEWEGRWGGPLAAIPTDEGDSCGVEVVGAEALPPNPTPPGWVP